MHQCRRRGSGARRGDNRPGTAAMLVGRTETGDCCQERSAGPRDHEVGIGEAGTTAEAPGSAADPQSRSILPARCRFGCRARFRRNWRLSKALARRWSRCPPACACGCGRAYRHATRHEQPGAAVQEKLGCDPHSSDLQTFRAKRGRPIKIRWHDGIGMSLYTKFHQAAGARPVYPAAAGR